MRLEIEVNFDEHEDNYKAKVVRAEGFGANYLIGLVGFGATEHSALKGLVGKMSNRQEYSKDDIKRWNDTCMDWEHIRRLYEPTKISISAPEGVAI